MDKQLEVPPPPPLPPNPLDAPPPPPPVVARDVWKIVAAGVSIFAIMVAASSGCST